MLEPTDVPTSKVHSRCSMGSPLMGHPVVPLPAYPHNLIAEKGLTTFRLPLLVQLFRWRNLININIFAAKYRANLNVYLAFIVTILHYFNFELGAAVHALDGDHQRGRLQIRTLPRSTRECRISVSEKRRISIMAS